MRRKTREEEAWLRERYPSAPNRELLDGFRAEFGWAPTAASLCSWASDEGLRKDRRNVDWAGHPEYDEFLSEFVPGHTEREISDAFWGRFGIRLTASKIGNAKTRLGLRSGTAGGRFENGHVPANKGRSWDDYMPAESQERCRSSQFKPGNVPWTADGKPVGYERVNRDGYVEVKVADGLQGRANSNFRLKHRVIWERANGRELRPGEVVLFADGDRRNFDPGNLVAVTQAENIGLSRIGRPYADRETLLDALKIVELNSAVSRAELRPRRCRECGGEFRPRFKGQRRCDRCLGRE